jgi:hypothetical protein
MTNNFLVNFKWVRIMPDWCSSGIWDRNSGNCDESELPVTPELISRIQEWQKRWDSQEVYLAPTLESEEEAEWIITENLLIAIEVAKQLPDWTVVINNSDGYFSLDTDENRNCQITADMKVSQDFFPLMNYEEF